MSEKNWTLRFVILIGFIVIRWEYGWFFSVREFNRVHECHCGSIPILRAQSPVQVFGMYSGRMSLETLVAAAVVLFVPALGFLKTAEPETEPGDGGDSQAEAVTPPPLSWPDPPPVEPVTTSNDLKDDPSRSREPPVSITHTEKQTAFHRQEVAQRRQQVLFIIAAAIVVFSILAFLATRVL